MHLLKLTLALCLFPLAGCSKFAAFNAIVPHCAVSTTGIAYGSLPRQKLDVYLPRHAIANAPVIVFFYGGYWVSGSRTDYRFVGEALAARGFVAILPDYRLYPEVAFPLWVNDAARAVRWAHDHAGVFNADVSHLYLMGHSAGAHTVALLTLDPHYLKDVGLDPSAIHATVAMSGPYDFVPGHELRDAFNLDMDNPQPNPRMEPVTFATDPHSPPMLLIHGLKDTVVEPDNPLKLAKRLKDHGANVTYRAYPNLGHAGIMIAFSPPFQWIAPVVDDIIAWVKEH